MPVDVIIGLGFGDEGKGKVTDAFAKKNKHNIIARFNGGNNAGHTINIDGIETILRSLPSGVLKKGTKNIITQGCVVNPDLLAKEISMVKLKHGIDLNLLISYNAFGLFQFHIERDKQEEARKNNPIGTTLQGIGPAYTDKIKRVGITMSDLYSISKLKDTYDYNMDILKSSEITFEDFRKITNSWTLKLEKYLGPAEDKIREYLENSERILAEGAQGALLDIDHGTYPFVTSTGTGISAVMRGLRVNHNDIGDVIGILKAYSTRVGEGPFPTQMDPELEDYFRKKTKEFGSVTGRKRSIGWPDLVAAKYAIETNGVSEIVLTRMDSMSYLNEINVCVGYELNGKKSSWPSSYSGLEEVSPVYKKFESWEDVGEIRDYNKLPKNALKFVEFIEETLNIPINYISVGPERDAGINR